MLRIDSCLRGNDHHLSPRKVNKMANPPSSGTDSVPPVRPVGPEGQYSGPPHAGGEHYYPQPQQFGGPPPPLTAKQAQANAKAAKAQAKALRPIYKKKRFYVLLAIVLIVIIAIANSVGGDDGATTGEPAGEAPPAAEKEAPPKKEVPANPGLNTPVESGDLSMTVTKIKCGVKSLGSSDFGVKADGQFCLMSLNAENTGDEAVTLSGDSQKLLDAKGRQFSADNEAWIYIGKQGSNVIFEEINPGNTSKGIVVFDVPKNVTPTQAIVSGDFFGGDEVTVDLK